MTTTDTRLMCIICMGALTLDQGRYVHVTGKPFEGHRRGNQAPGGDVREYEMPELLPERVGYVYLDCGMFGDKVICPTCRTEHYSARPQVDEYPDVIISEINRAIGCAECGV